METNFQIKEMAEFSDQVCYSLIEVKDLSKKWIFRRANFPERSFNFRRFLETIIYDA